MLGGEVKKTKVEFVTYCRISKNIDCHQEKWKTAQYLLNWGQER
jgi:hypothetical protein